MEDKSRNSIQKDIFYGNRKDINYAIYHICEFTGTSNRKLIFFSLEFIHSKLYEIFVSSIRAKKRIRDLREPLIDGLYKPCVPQSRMETLIEPLDMVLNQLCDIIVDPLQDCVVTGILQASLVWMLE